MRLQKIVLSTVAAFALMQPAAQTLAADINAGKINYDKLCASCHGPNGKGNPAMVKAMGEEGLNIVTKEVQSKKDEELIKVIVEGKGKMPASGKNLSKQEQQEIVRYVRSLTKEAK